VNKDVALNNESNALSKGIRKKSEKTATGIAKEFMGNQNSHEKSRDHDKSKFRYEDCENQKYASSNKKDPLFIKSSNNYYVNKDRSDQMLDNYLSEQERGTFKRCSSAKQLTSKKKERNALGNSAERKIKKYRQIREKNNKVTPKQVASNLMIKKALKMLNKEQNEAKKVESKQKNEQNERHKLLNNLNKRIRQKK